MAATCAQLNRQRHLCKNKTYKQESGPKDLFKKQKNLQGLISKKKLLGTKTQIRYICKDQKHILAYKKI